MAGYWACGYSDSGVALNHVEIITHKTLTLFIILLATGCTGNPVIPVSDLTGEKTKHSARIVRPGDTLYTIAWEAGLDYREVARWNRLNRPYRLSPGDRVILSAAGQSAATDQPEVTPRALKSTSALKTKSTAPKQNVPSVVRSSKTGSVPASRQEHNWDWPSDGEVITKFDVGNGDNGIDISGSDGSPIRAAASGRIVYAGSGLRGYGLLLIIKHDESYLSAYAHNRLLLVDEGDQVGKGQVVAEMGSSGAESTRLHFEIRHNGKPIDPLKRLPAR